jgi:hypothetical protein
MKISLSSQKKKKNISPLAFLYQHSTFSYFFPLKSTQSLLLPNSISQFQLRTKRSKLHFYLVVAMKIENPLHKFNEKPSQTHAQLTNSIKHQICHTHPSDIMNFKPKSNTNPDHNSIKTTRKQRERQVKKKKNKNAHSIINYWLVRNSQNAGDFRFSPSDPQINRLLAIITDGYAIGSYNFIGIVEVLEFNVDPYPHTNFSFAANERREKHDIERERERDSDGREESEKKYLKFHLPSSVSPLNFLRDVTEKKRRFLPPFSSCRQSGISLTPHSFAFHCAS